MKKSNIFLLLFISLLAVSCADTNNVIKPGDKPVIEAYIAPGKSVTMKVFTEIPYLNADSSYSKPINGLNIKISNSSGNSFVLNSEGEGVYNSNNKELIGPSGTLVGMSFTYNGRNISASTVIPPKPIGFTTDLNEITRVARDFSKGPPTGGGPGGFGQEPRQTINLAWKNSDNVYHFVAAQSLEQNPTPVTIQPTNGNNNLRPQRRFNNQPIQASQSSLQSQSFEYFGKYALILYRLNPDYAALYVNNNTSSQNIATPISTITNGLGIFTGINADTLVLNVKKAK